jgi:hypothetical protein
MSRTIAASVLLAGATISWSLLIAADGPWAADAAALIGATMVALAAIAITGVLVASSRWGRWLSVGVAAVAPLLGIAVPIGAWWVTNLVASTIVLAAFAGTATSGVVRRLPRADGPTPRVVAFILGLATIPLLVGVVSPDGLGSPEWIMAGASALAAVAYSKATDFSVIGVRVMYPIVAVIAVLLAGWPRGVIWFAIGTVVTAAAWQRDIRVAVHPPSERGHAVPMLPEMVPGEILEAAGLDEHGKRKHRS